MFSVRTLSAAFEVLYAALPLHNNAGGHLTQSGRLNTLTVGW